MLHTGRVHLPTHIGLYGCAGASGRVCGNPRDAAKQNKHHACKPNHKPIAKSNSDGKSYYFPSH